MKKVSYKELRRYIELKSHKSVLIALILNCILGSIGAHYFYVGKMGVGILYLLTGGLFGIGVFIDFFRILFGRFKDRYHFPLKW